jgi:hypothetical protein
VDPEVVSMSDPTNAEQPRQEDDASDTAAQPKLVAVQSSDELLTGIAIVITEEEYEENRALRAFLDGLAKSCDDRSDEEGDIERHNSDIKVHCPRAMAWKPK